MAEVDMKLANFAIDKLNQTVEMNKRLQQQSDIAVRSLNSTSEQNRVKNYRNLVNDETDDIKQMFELTKGLNLSDKQLAQMLKANGLNYKTTEAQNAIQMFSGALETSDTNNQAIFTDFNENVKEKSGDDMYAGIVSIRNNTSYDKTSTAYKNIETQMENKEKGFIFDTTKEAGQLTLTSIPFLSEEEKTAFSNRLKATSNVGQVESVLKDAMSRAGQISNNQAEVDKIVAENLLSGSVFDTITKLNKLQKDAVSNDVRFTADAGLNVFNNILGSVPFGMAGQQFNLDKNKPVILAQPDANETFSINLGNRQADRIPLNAAGEVIPSPSAGISKQDAERIKQHFKANPGDYKSFRDKLLEAYPDMPVPETINY